MSSQDLQQQETPTQPGEPAKSGSARKYVIILLLVAIVAFFVWRIHGNGTETKTTSRRDAGAADRAIPVQLAPVEQKTMPIYLTALGTVTAYNTVTIKSRVDGQLQNVNFREGQQVHKGDLLLQIDPSPYKAALAQAEGQLAKDQATAENGKAESARYSALYQAGVVSKESEQTQTTTYGQAVGTIKADEAAIEAAKVNLAYTRITSPIDGQVGLRQVDVGNIVHASDSTGLLVITQLKPISVIFTLPEDQLPLVFKTMRGESTVKPSDKASGHSGKGGDKAAKSADGAPRHGKDGNPKSATDFHFQGAPNSSRRGAATLTVEAYDRGNTTKIATGTLLTLDNQIDPTTGMDKLKAVFDNADGSLFPNQFVNIRLVLENRPNVIVVPASSLQTGSQGTFVYVAAKDDAGNMIVNVRPVTTSLTEGAQVLIDSGLEAGEQVVIDGQEKLREGSKIVPVKPAGSGGGKSGGKGKGKSSSTPTPDADKPKQGQAQ